MFCKLFGFSVATIVAGVVSAETVTWTNEVTSAAQQYTNTLFWVDGSGSNPSVPPTNATSTAVFPKIINVEKAVSQRVDVYAFPGEKTTATGQKYRYQVEAIKDDDPYTRREINFLTGDYSRCWSTLLIFEINNPNDFLGYWNARGEGVKAPGGADMSGSGSVQYVLTGATAENPAVLHNLSAKGRINVEVPTAGAKARIGVITEDGVIDKRGAGELEFGSTPGANLQVQVVAGSVKFSGRPAGRSNADIPVDGAWMWLDASRADSFTFTSKAGDARQYVTKWSDVRGADYPYAAEYTDWVKDYQDRTYLEPSCGIPYRVADPILGGKYVVDFGRSSSDPNADNGPTNCCLKFSVANTMVREVFFVARKKGSIGYSTAPVGDMNKYPFHPGSEVLVGNTGNIAQEDFVRAGNLIINGKVAGADTSAWSVTDYVVASAAPTNNISLMFLGSERMYCGRVGGVVLAEVILFTNRLTNVERFNIHRYLQRKWKGDAGDAVEAGYLTLKSEETPVNVASGREAFVPEVNVGDGTLVKEGDGKLKIGMISASAAENRVNIQVEGGSVAFGGIDDVDDSRPAGVPMIWLKAEEQYMTFSNTVDQSGNKYVIQWRDCRDGHENVYAQLPDGDAVADYNGKAIPTLVKNDCGDLHVVDFGTYGGADVGSYLNVAALKGRTLVKDAFLVKTFKSGTGGPPIQADGNGVPFGTDGVANQMMTDHGTYGTSLGRSALWTYDGTVVNPVIPQSPRTVGEYHVYGISSPLGLPMWRIGHKSRVDKDGTKVWGGVRIGEWLFYTNVLTAAERRQTQAYLTKRWKGRRSSAAKQVINEVTFADGLPKTVETDRPLTVNSVSGGTDSLVTKGAGNVTINAMGIDDVKTISVEGGNVTLDFSLSQAPAFDFDAQKTATMTVTENWTPEAYEGQPNSDKVARTIVTEWRDASNNGIVADYQSAYDYDTEHPLKSSKRVLRAPVLTTLETKTGVTKPVVFFGAIGGPNTGNCKSQKYGACDSSAMFLNKSFNTTEKLSEFFAIFKDDNNGRPRAFTVNSRLDEAFLRGNQNNKAHHRLGAVIDGDGSASDVRNGYIAIDTTEITPPDGTNTVLSGCHLVNFAPLSAQNCDTLFYCNSGYYTGGGYLGESVAFKNPLSLYERRSFQRYLMNKWFDEENPAFGGNLDTISIAAGSTLTVSGDKLPTSFSVKAIVGGGTLACSMPVQGINRIETKCAADGGSWSKTVIGSAVTFNGAVTVAIDPVEPKLPKSGTYAIFQANSLSGVNLENWTISNAKPSVARNYSLQVNGTTVSLKVNSCGFIIMAQ